MSKPLDLVTLEGLDRTCREFEQMGENMSPFALMATSATVDQARNEMEEARKKGKRPGAELWFREFFLTLMLVSFHKQEELQQ